MLYKQPGSLNCCTRHFCRHICRFQVLCTQQGFCKASSEERWSKWSRSSGEKKNRFLTVAGLKFSSGRSSWLGKTGFCHRKALWDSITTASISLAVNIPCSALAENYLEISLSILQSILSSNINQPRLSYQTQCKCDLNWCWQRLGGETAEGGEEFVCFFYCVRMNLLKRGRCSFNNKEKKNNGGKNERRNERKKKERCLSCLGSWSTKEQSWAVTSWSCSLEHDTCQAMINGAECVQFQAQCPWDAQDPDRKCYC